MDVDRALHEVEEAPGSAAGEPLESTMTLKNPHIPFLVLYTLIA